jgi:hypothetical protein
MTTSLEADAELRGHVLKILAGETALYAALAEAPNFANAISARPYAFTFSTTFKMGAAPKTAVIARSEKAPILASSLTRSRVARRSSKRQNLRAIRGHTGFVWSRQAQGLRQTAQKNSRS